MKRPSAWWRWPDDASPPLLDMSDFIRGFALMAALLGQSWLPLMGASPAAAGGPIAADPICGPTNAPLLIKPAPLHPQTAGTKRMVELLQKTRAEVEAHPENTVFLNDRIATWLEHRLEQTTNQRERLTLQPKLAAQLLNAGKSELALQELNRFQDSVAQLGLDLGPHNLSVLDISRAMCYLRIGEQENCLLNHNVDSCLFPIREGGVHKLQRGSRAAIEVLTEHLKRFPDDLRGRWLLNIASMTVGDYPEKVPSQWLIPPKVFESDYDIKRFPDVAANLGLDIEGLAGGCIVEDFDGDGTVGTGGSFGASPLRQEIGLGDATAIEKVEIYWPVTGQTQSLKALLRDHFYRVREGDSEATLWDLKSFSVLAGAGQHQHHSLPGPTPQR